MNEWSKKKNERHLNCIKNNNKKKRTKEIEKQTTMITIF
jgi:hypothetical protein